MSGFKTVGLFAGIGGFERGLELAGHKATHLVDNAPGAIAVLKERFDAEVLSDVRNVDTLPRGTELLTAGFPCQDLSSVGRKEGIAGTRSSLVGEVFRLLETAQPRWAVLENVPFLLQLGKGKALKLVTSALNELGYDWAYRVIDSQSFGLAQRRRRWYLVATTGGDPRGVLLSGNAEPRETSSTSPACGFYWTEGMRALGWAVDAVPPIKGGSSVGVPSPPAIVMPNGNIVTPEIRDAERLQGFQADWTKPAEEAVRANFRWQLVGNAVTVNAAEWLGRRLLEPETYDNSLDAPMPSNGKWPYAAWRFDGVTRASASNVTPVWADRESLMRFLRYPTKPLSTRAAEGFLKRTRKGSLRFPPGFLATVEAHIAGQPEPPEFAKKTRRHGQLGLFDAEAA